MIALWDLGNVLVQWDPQVIYPAFNLSPEHTDFLRSNLLEHPDWLRLDQGLTTEAEVAARLLRESVLSLQQIQQCFEVIRQSLVDLAPSIALVRQMKEAGIPMYVLSNMSHENAGYLRTREYFSLFDGIVISAEENLIKPDPLLFQRVLDRYELPVEKVFFIDDSEPNIIAARGIGMQTLHFKRTENCYASIKQTFELA